MSLTNCRFYEGKYPEIDSFVMVNVKQVRYFHQMWMPSRSDANLKLVDRGDGRIRQTSRIRQHRWHDSVV